MKTPLGFVEHVSIKSSFPATITATCGTKQYFAEASTTCFRFDLLPRRLLGQNIFANCVLKDFSDD